MDSLANRASRSARRAAAHLQLGASRNVHAALNRARFELRKALEQSYRELQGLAP